jgi:hypothetical protein
MKKKSNIKIDWEGTADYYEEENRKLKRDKFGDYLCWTLILTGFLFLIDIWVYTRFIK